MGKLILENVTVSGNGGGINIDGKDVTLGDGTYNVISDGKRTIVKRVDPDAVDGEFRVIGEDPALPKSDDR